jgi:hypothetical protein
MVRWPGSFSFHGCGFQIVCTRSAQFSYETELSSLYRAGREPPFSQRELHQTKPSPSPEASAENKGAPPWPLHIGRGVGAIFFPQRKSDSRDEVAKKPSHGR